jgi:hypothetical protein
MEYLSLPFPLDSFSLCRNSSKPPGKGDTQHHVISTMQRDGPGKTVLADMHREEQQSLNHPAAHGK